MIEFKPFQLEDKALYDTYLFCCGERGCEYSFANLYLWGRQQAAIENDRMLFFSQYNRRSVYLFPIGPGDLKTAVDAIICDASQRGIPCRLTGLLQEDCQQLQLLYPDRFRFHFDRDSFDYVYAIDDLAELKGRKFQKKRNHLNRFRQAHPEHRLVEITEENIGTVEAFVELWYQTPLEENPYGDYQMEQVAIRKALRNRDSLGLEGLMLLDGDTPLAMALGSLLSEDTFDIHFEKALDIADGAYAAINQGFAAYLWKKYPQLLWLNREDDMGLEGLRKAKLSYCPDHMIEKHWSCLLEDCYDY